MGLKSALILPVRRSRRSRGEVREHDPIQALDGEQRMGIEALPHHRFDKAATYLEPGGVVAVEIGYDQTRGGGGPRSWREVSAVAGQSSDFVGADRAVMFSSDGFKSACSKKGLGNRFDCR